MSEPTERDKEETNMKNEITIDGITYAAKTANGNRAVIVADRGWIFAGDVTEKDGRIRLTRAVHVFRWESIGFDGMLREPKSEKVTLKKISDVDMPADAELFRCPVADDWGL